MKTWIVIALSALVAVVAIAYGVGARLPREHVASARAHFRQPADSIYHAVSDVAGYPSWRVEVKRVERLADRDGRMRWRETSTFGLMEFEATVAAPPTRFVSSIVSTGAGFGGRWIYQLVADSTGTVLTITEEGTVDNPFFRILSRYVFGLHATMETLLRELGKRFGKTTAPERVR